LDKLVVWPFFAVPKKLLERSSPNPTPIDLIDGVRIEPLQVYPNDRGFVMEMARLGKGLATDGS
jgi:hypothetical protein